MQWLSARFLASFVLSALTGLTLTVDAYAGGIHAARFAAVLVGLNALHALMKPRLVIPRELVLYLLLIAYMLISLLWTDDFDLALPVILLSINFALIMLLIGALF